MKRETAPEDRLYQIRRTLLIACAWYIVIAGVFYWIVGHQWTNQPVKAESVIPSNHLGELSGNVIIEQPITAPGSVLDKLTLYAGTFGRENDSVFLLEILESGKTIAAKTVQAAALEDGKQNTVVLDQPLDLAGRKALLLRITISDVPAGQGITLWYGSEVAAGKFNIAVPDQAGFRVNGTPYEGSLCLSLMGRNVIQMDIWYWSVTALILLGTIACFAVTYAKQKRGIRGFVLKYMDLLDQYRFLIKQLVMRDFKVKYKRSMLGALWSFLNPLLTMAVQFIVFSTIFKTDVPNFLVYLLTGIVMFTFFSESVSLGMTSIVGNASLIKKVYMPKYIYPVARVLSSAINMLISLIPLLLMMILTGISFSKALLLLPIPIFFMLLFCTGMSFLMSTSMVFFRDTQFLWGVLVSLWMYLTPIFYPETIIPAAILPIYRMNPMYQFIFFVRSITLEGVSPPPINYVYCAICAAVPLLLGIWVFKRKQDKFVLYL